MSQQSSPNPLHDAAQRLPRPEENQQAAEATHPAPSTFDYADAVRAIKGGQDPVLATIAAARERYFVGATPGNYVGYNTVCAAGALLAVDENIIARGRDMAPRRGTAWAQRFRSIMDDQMLVANSLNGGEWELFEHEAAESTRVALDRLNSTAEDHPELGNWTDLAVALRDARSCSGWSFGHIETLNQELPWGDGFRSEGGAHESDDITEALRQLSDPQSRLYSASDLPTRLWYDGQLMPTAKAVVLMVYDATIAELQAEQPAVAVQ